MSNEMLMKGMALTGKAREKLTFPIHGEIKYDEIRCRVLFVPGDGGIAAPGGLSGHIEYHSFAGKPLHNLSGFSQRFFDFFSYHGGVLTELDIGILVNGNFNDSYRWTRSSTGWPQEKLDKATGKVAPALVDSMVEFYVFDIPELDTEWVQRRRQRRVATEQLSTLFRLPAKHPHWVDITDQAGIDACFAESRAKGHEGVMLKEYNHTYRRGKAVGGWWKMKPSDDVDGKIIGFTEAVSEAGVPLGRVGSVTVEVVDGPAVSYASPTGFKHDLACDIWQNQADYLGRWLTFDYMERDRAGGYRHPHFNRFREDK